MEISVNTKQISRGFTAFETRGTKESDFDELLKAEAPAALPPDKWTKMRLYVSTPAGYIPDAGVIEDFKDYMSDNFGVDIDKVVPSHEITLEQEKLLASRYDLSALRNAAVGSEEHTNFMLDLVYLGVFSIDEASTMCAKALPIPPGEKGVLTRDESGRKLSDNFLDAVEDSAAELADFLMEYISRKYGSLRNAPIEVREWYDGSMSTVDEKRGAAKILAEFFSRLTDDNSEKYVRGEARLNIENARGRLEEDLGGMM